MLVTKTGMQAWGFRFSRPRVSMQERVYDQSGYQHMTRELVENIRLEVRDQ